jgi:hypothetical protein
MKVQRVVWSLHLTGNNIGLERLEGSELRQTKVRITKRTNEKDADKEQLLPHIQWEP